ncbi:MAG: glycosyl transferase family 39 [Ramlibacter sp.]|nr:glycosyl transferase family 39 [Ramlibacter sp.]
MKSSGIWAPLRTRLSAQAWLLLAICAWLACTAWARPLMLPDEGRYVGVAWEMLRSGNWLTPTLDGMPFFHKPPLFYWLTAASLWLFGAAEWAARLASLAGATAAAYALYRFTLRWTSRRSARAVLVVLATHPMFFLGAQFANLDMLVAACITLTILLLADSVFRAERGEPFRLALAGAWASAAAGLMAKGLIGVALPMLVVGPWLIATGRLRLLPRLLWPPAVGLFLALTLPWFLAMQARYPQFYDYFFVVQHFKRFAAGGFNNVQPFWFYPVVLAVLSLPWLAWGIGRWRRGTRNREGRGLRALMAWWVFSVVMFFSVPQSKLVGYILPAVPPLAWLIGEAATRLRLASARARKAWAVTAIVAVMLDLGVVAAVALHEPSPAQALAPVLAHERVAGQPVFFLRNYLYDLPFYAHLTGPVFVVDQWADSSVQQHDNWRKELADAGQFGNSGQLVEASRFKLALCGSPVSWVFGSEGDAQAFSFQASESVAAADSLRMWRVDRDSPAWAAILACPVAPGAASPVEPNPMVQ